MSISEQLRRALAESGLSLYRVAKDAGIPYAAVHGFANDGTDLRLSTVDRLANVLGLVLAAAPGRSAEAEPAPADLHSTPPADAGPKRKRSKEAMR